jgi:nucleoside-diphosphate-sugar epimerase
MNVLVTGASGRIGANLVAALAREGHSVRGAVRPGSPRRAKLEALVASLPVRHARASVVEADLVDRDALERLVADGPGGEAIVHNGVVFTADPALMVKGSLEATAALLEAARQQGCPRFVFVSSASVYEGTAYRPGDPVREEEAVPDVLGGVYGACKLAAEALCAAYHRQHGLPALSIRLPMVVAGQEFLTGGFLLETWLARTPDPDPSPEMSAWRLALERAWAEGARLVVPLNRDGSAWKRHYLDVRDAARAVALSLTAPEAPGRSYNVASVPVRYDEAVTALSPLSGWQAARIPFPLAEQQYRYAFSLARAAEFLGYIPALTGPQMITDAWRHRQGEEVPGLVAP